MGKIIKVGIVSVAIMTASGIASADDAAATKAPEADAPKVAVNGVSKAVEPIVSTDPKIIYLVRVAAVHKLSKTLAGADQTALLAYLSERYGAKWGFMTPMQFNAVKNELVIALARQSLADLGQDIANRMMVRHSARSSL